MALRRTMTSRYSWGENPRVFTQVTKKVCPTEIGYPSLKFVSPSLPQSPLDCNPEDNLPENVLDQNIKIKLLPLPPPSCALKVLKRSNAAKALRHDPFLLAYKQCTQSGSNSSIKRLFSGLFVRKKEKKNGAEVIGSELETSDSKFSFKSSKVASLPRYKSGGILRSMSFR